LVAVVMRHTFDGAGLILLCSCSYALGFGFGFIELKWMFSIYELGQLKITNLLRLGPLEWLEKTLIIKTARVTIPCVQPEMKFRSLPGQFHHDPPLHNMLQKVPSTTGTDKLALCALSLKLLFHSKT